MNLSESKIQPGNRSTLHALWEQPGESQSGLETGIWTTNELGANYEHSEKVKTQEHLETLGLVYYEQ